jgi:drug/metabolite transporter (DMT)-like permease
MERAGRGIGWMVVSVLLFAAANVLVKDLRHLPTLQLVFLRSALSLVVTAGYLAVYRLPVLGTNRTWMLIRGVAGVISLSAFFHTVRTIPLASATVIQYTSPIFTVLLAGPVLGQTTRPVQWALLTTAFVGVVLIKGFDPLVPWDMWLLGLFSAAFAAVSYVATTRCRDTDHPVGIVLWFHLIAVPVTALPVAWNWHPLSSVEWGEAAAIGVLSVLAQIAMTIALHRDAAGTIMPFKYVGALAAAAFGYFLFDERLSLGAAAGMGIVVLALTANTWYVRRFQRTT